MRGREKGLTVDWLLRLPDGDLCSAVFLVIVVLTVGARMVDGQPRLTVWGRRLGAFTLVGVCGLRAIMERPDSPGHWFGIVIGGLLAAGMVQGVTWVILPLVALMYDSSIGAALDCARRWVTQWQSAWKQARLAREEGLRRHQMQDVYDRGAPERELARREAEARARDETDAQRRREQAREECELLYELNASDLSPVLRRDFFQDYLARYMSDKQDADYVTARGRKLIEQMQQALQRVRPTQEYRDLADIGRAFEEQRRLIEESNQDDMTKQSQLIELQEEYDEEVKRFIRRRAR